MQAGWSLDQDQNSDDPIKQSQMDVQLDSARTLETVQKLADSVRQLISDHEAPSIGIVCGSGLGNLVQLLSNPKVISYEAIPGFPRTGVKGHEGNLVFGHLELDGKSVSAVVMQGRCHPYEGFSFWQSTLPVRVMHALGVRTLILTNAAGALNKNLKPGNIMMIKDHIFLGAFAGANPLFGLRDNQLGARFVSLWNIYDKDYRKAVHKSAAELQLTDTLREGVFVMFPGPSFETVAEARALRSLGGDVVAMSTAHEAIVARHCGIKVLAFSVVSNYVCTEYDDDDDHEENGASNVDHSDVLRAVEAVVPSLAKLLLRTLSTIHAQDQ